MSPDPYTIKAGIVVAAIAAILYDIYLDQDEVSGNTYSQVLRGWFKKRLWLYYGAAFGLGILMAHWGPV